MIGGNGAGKSTLLRIMAGQDTDFVGEAWLAKVIQSATCRTRLDETLSVFENVKLGVAPTQALLDEFNEITGRMGEPLDDDEMTKLYDRMGCFKIKSCCECLGIG